MAQDLRPPSAKELLEYHDLIREWFLAQKITREEIRTALKKPPFYLNVSIKQLESRLKAWGFRRNIKKEEYTAAHRESIAYIKKRPLEQSEVRLRGTTVSETKLKKARQRYNLTDPKLVVEMTGIDPAVPTEESTLNSLILVSSPIAEVTSRLQALQLDRLPIFEFSRQLPDIIADYRKKRMYVSYGPGNSNYLETTVLSPTSLIQPFGFLDWLSEEADTPMPSADEYLTRAPVVDAFERQVESIPFGDIQKLTPKSNIELHTRHADFLTFPLRKVIQSPVLQFENGQIINSMENLAALRLLQSIVYRFSNNLMSNEDIRITVYFIFENNLDSIIQCILEQQDESAKAFGQALLRETFSQKRYMRLSKLIFQLKTGLLLSVASEILQRWDPDPEVVDVILENIPETDWAVVLRRYKSGALEDVNSALDSCENILLEYSYYKSSWAGIGKIMAILHNVTPRKVELLEGISLLTQWFCGLKNGVDRLEFFSGVFHFRWLLLDPTGVRDILSQREFLEMAIFLGDFEFIQASFNTSLGFEASNDALLQENSLNRQVLLIWVFSQTVQSVEILEFFIAKGLDLYQTSSFGDIKTVLKKVSSFENLKDKYATSSSPIRYRAPILPDFEILGRILEEYYYCKDRHLSALEIAILFTEPLKLEILHERIRSPPDIGRCLILAASSHKPWEMLDCISKIFSKSNQDLLRTAIQTKAFTIIFIFGHGSGRLVKMPPLYTSLLKDPSDQADTDLCYLLKFTDIGQEMDFDVFDTLFNIPGLKESTQRLLFEAFTKKLTFEVEPCEISGTVNYMLNSFEIQFAVNNLSEYAAKFGFEFLIPLEFKHSLLEECFEEIAGRSCCAHCKKKFLESRRHINIKGPFEALLMSHEQQQLARGANQIKLLLSYGLLNSVCIEPIGEQFITRVESLISSGYDVNSRSPDGWSILFHSALYQNWSFNILKKLVHMGISVLSFRYPQPSPIIMAINRGNTEALEFILENGGESIMNIAGIMHFDHKRGVERMRSVLLITPLMLACRKGDIQSVTLLLIKGANVNMLLPNIKKQPRTALEEACYHGRLDIVALLLNNGANRVAAALDLTPPHFSKIKKLLRRHM